MKNKILTLALAFSAISIHAQEIIPMPKPGPVPTIKIGKSNEFKLDNGLNVIVVENHKLPVVQASLVIDNKPLFLGNKKGTEVLLSEILGNGTQNISKHDFNERIELLGADISFSSNSAYVSSLKKYFNEVFGLMAEGALNPNFDESDFNTFKNRTIEGLKTNEKSVDKISSRVRNLLVYGKNHPFGEYLTEDKIKNLTLKDAQDYYNQYFRPNNAYLVVVGDITTDEVKSLVNKTFKNWKPADIKVQALPKVNQLAKTQVDVVNVPNAVQSVVSVTYPIELDKKNPDYYALKVATTIFGGDFYSKLNMNLRENKGWTYGAEGGFVDSRYTGRFIAIASVRNEVTVGSVKEMIKEMNSMINDKVNPEQLEEVKNKFSGNFILSLEKPLTIANQSLTLKTEDLSKSFYEDYIKNINKVTVEDVARVSKKYFKPEQAHIVVTGKASDFADEIEKLGYPVFYYDNYGNIIKKP